MLDFECILRLPQLDAIAMTEFGTVVGGIFGGRADFEGKSRGYIDDTIRSGQLRLAVLIWVMFILSVLSIFIELVPGYCVGGGAAGVTWSALPHGVWQVPNLVTLFFAIQVGRCGLPTLSNRSPSPRQSIWASTQTLALPSPASWCACGSSSSLAS